MQCYVTYTLDLMPIKHDNFYDSYCSRLYLQHTLSNEGLAKVASFRAQMRFFNFRNVPMVLGQQENSWFLSHIAELMC